MVIDNVTDVITAFQDNQEYSIGIVIGQTGRNQLHCGVAFKTDNAFNVLHLAWHFDLRHETYISKDIDNFFWIKPKIHPTRQYVISALCQRIIERKNTLKIPYGLIFKDSVFLEDGKLLLGNSEVGLTCATFVLAIFNSCFVNLIDIGNWQIRKEDEIWHKNIINILECTIEDKRHIEFVKGEIGCSRYRPEEVAISSAFQYKPATFEEITTKGFDLREKILK